MEEMTGNWRHVFKAIAENDQTFEVKRRVNRDYVELQIIDSRDEEQWIDAESMVMRRQVHIDGGYRNMNDAITGWFLRRKAPTFCENYLFYRADAIQQALRLRQRYEESLARFKETGRALKGCESDG